MKPFDYVNSISYNKKNLMRGTENDELAEKEYVPFLTNRAFSYYTDTILYANEMNRRLDIDNLLQYEYLLNSIRPNKRFSKWVKKEETKEIQCLARYFSVNYRQAEEYFKILTPDNVKRIVQEIEKL